MFTFLRRTSTGRKDRTSQALSPFADSPETSRHRAVGQTVDEDDIEDEDGEDDRLLPTYRDNRQTSYFGRARVNAYEEEEEEQEDDEADGEDAIETPLLPIFSAAHLDRLPLYNITHAIRLLIVQKCETTLSWDQLRSPQISQFLVKPIQNQIQTNHFNRATLCALAANCLQFQKEAQLQPGNVGVLRTRALMSELLAMRLIKEFTTRELIDALSYDFDPLQGMSPPTTDNVTALNGSAWPAHQLDLQSKRAQAKGARVSTIEVAIKAQAKRFLAHQLVVQHLEAIWAGTVVFHSEADNLHRKPSTNEEPFPRGRRYGTIDDHSPTALPADSVLSRKAHNTRTTKRPSTDVPFARRSVTLYNPRDASLFKLSRLRVPRYRQIFTTISFATMLALFLAVLVERSLDITALEILFWFWSVGYMLDEVVGFTEQGFGLYILSFWNAFDVGILLLFVTYYCLRLYGIVLAEQNKLMIANYAYDVLASTAILLFPRLFSVLDHYRYFSQLLIAFRMMAQDLIAILVLILISCSGFFVAFTLSFADPDTGSNGVAYALFQILMGFTPAAWDKWSGYNMLGKAIMAVFLIICHFLIVTILITVLTNSFMAIVQNANEEHQYLFAINTISMVKSDALFSYVAPTNVVEWLLSPLRYVMPFRQYVKFNRTVIKATHFPMLFAIFGYERVILSKFTYGLIEQVENQPKPQGKPLAFSINRAPDMFSPTRRLIREPSVVSFNKDRALDEVFRRPFRGSSTVRRTPREPDTDKRHSHVDKWMEGAENEGGASPPLEQPRSVVERLEDRRPTFRRAATADKARLMMRSREFSIASRSMVSDPDILSTIASRRPQRPQRIDEESEELLLGNVTLPQETDADGDDENNGESELAGPAIGESAVSILDKENKTPKYESEEEEEYFQTPIAGKSPMMQLSSGRNPPLPGSPVIAQAANAQQAKARPRKLFHDRKASTNTTLFAPQYVQAEDSSSTNPLKPPKPLTAKNTNTGGTVTPTPVNLLSGQRTPKLKPARARPIMPPRQKTAPGLTAGVGMTLIDTANARSRQPSFNARALDLASEIGDNKWAPVGGMATMPNSFSEQLLREREIERRQEEARRRSEEEEKGMVNRIMLARMHTLEEGFREVLREIKDLSRSNANSSWRDSDAEASQTVREPKTPSRKHSGSEVKTKRSPKRSQGQQKKGKEAQRPAVAVHVDWPDQPSPKSAQSVVAKSSEEDAGADDGDGRPGTAVRTPDPGRQID
ncbi:hypothetical protein LTR37_006679 [Vermiconidia calcicola]|uniref:Uncharacterized protein n=1 Tax=Vermiconidia calcicola TaxID=1690605 RepID=A0ACC3NFZ7_9PEZI|nr:hypothetical protein LTR37_006679 [Vermiconidia calcicola]